MLFWNVALLTRISIGMAGNQLMRHCTIEEGVLSLMCHCTIEEGVLSLMCQCTIEEGMLSLMCRCIIEEGVLSLVELPCAGSCACAGTFSTPKFWAVLLPPNLLSTIVEMSWNVLKCLEMSWNVLKCLEMSWNMFTDLFEQAPVFVFTNPFISRLESLERLQWRPRGIGGVGDVSSMPPIYAAWPIFATSMYIIATPPQSYLFMIMCLMNLGLHKALCVRRPSLFTGKLMHSCTTKRCVFAFFPQFQIELSYYDSWFLQPLTSSSTKNLITIGESKVWARGDGRDR